jgi:hypothetical protein
MPLQILGARSDGSPSLDRIDPGQGYVPGNVRVISDRANRLKGDRSIETLRLLSATAAASLRADYALVAAYVERETLPRLDGAAARHACLFLRRLVLT